MKVKLTTALYDILGTKTDEPGQLAELINWQSVEKHGSRPDDSNYVLVRLEDGTLAEIRATEYEAVES